MREEVRIFLSTGETSGDLYASYLAKAIKEEIPQASFWGMGGEHMRKAGITLLIHSAQKGAIGIVESLKVLPFFIYAFWKIKNFLSENPPHLLILIDFGAFNLRLGRWAKRRGIQTLYFIPPGSWRRRVGENVALLKQSADKVICIFPWNKEALEEKGIEAYFFGHPLLDILEKEAKEKARTRLGLEEAPTVGLLPGSRLQEIRYVLPTLLQTVPLIKRTIPEAQFVLAPPESSLAFLKKILPKGWTISDKLLKSDENIVHLRPGQSWSVINASNALIITSGTATLESAVLETPFIVVYKGSFLTKIEYKLRRMKLPYISLPNIILERKEIPELLQEQANPSLLANLTCNLILNEEERNRQMELFREIKAKLGGKGMFLQTAKLIKGMVLGK
ncbi:MAG: lipid-A-disaccharide synthase [bacterium]